MNFEVRPVQGGDELSVRPRPWWRRFGMSWWSDWKKVFRLTPYHWTDFTVVNVSGEADWRLGEAELNLALCGFHVRVTWYWPDEQRDELSRIARGWLETKPLVDENEQ